jgi:Fic family protein
LGFLDGLLSIAPDNELLAELLLLQESCFSKMIDYSDINIRSMFIEQGESEHNDNIQNIATAYRYAMNRTTQKLSYTTIFKHALYGNDPERRVTIRAKPIFLTQSSSNYRQYNPTAPHKIQPALIDISDYIKSSNTDALIKAAMCHYQFEMIHPYECYNGVVGRILPYHILNNAELNGVRFCSLSASLYRHKAEYFNKLESTQKHGNYAEWISFFIHIIKEAAQRGIEFIQYYNTLSKNDKERILARHQNRADHTLAVYQHFKRNIASSIGNTSKELQLSFPTVSRSVVILQELEILTQITDKARNRVFAHAGLMERLAFHT